MTVKERLKTFAKSMGLTNQQLEVQVGLSNGYIANMRDSVGKVGLERISNKFPELNTGWLLTGDGEMLRKPIISIPKEDQGHVATAMPSAEGIPLIPLDAMAGFCSGNFAQILEYECERFVIPTFRGAEFMIPVKGVSMFPKYSSGDIVACKRLPLDTFFQWNKVYVVDTEQGVVIKRVMPGKDEDHIKMVSENEQYPPFEIHKSEIISLAIVIGVIRRE